MENQKNSQTKLKVYYDGLCKLCSKEMSHYKTQAGSENIEFVDICAPTFDAGKEKMDPFEIHKIMHVRKLDGSIATRVDAFIAIWNTLPKYNWLARLAENRLVHSGLELGYSCFAAVRPWLPRYKADVECQDSPYCEVKLQ